MLVPTPHRIPHGFTLVELMITLSVAALLMVAALPAIGSWIASARVRSVAESLQNAIRTAQNEAITRQQQTVLVLTTGAPAWNAAATANGRNWAIHAQPRANSAEAALGVGDASAHPFLQGSTVATQSNVAITGPALLCFNSMGRIVSSTNTPIPGANGATCSTGTATNTTVIYTLAKTNQADARRYQVQVRPGGQVRMCDQGKTRSATAIDGC